MSNPDIFDKDVVAIRSARLTTAQMVLLLVHILSTIQKVVTATVLNDFVGRRIIRIKQIRRTTARPAFQITIRFDSALEHGVGDFLRRILH